MVRAFDIDVTQLHNDSTSITLTGIDYRGGGGTRAAKVVAKPTFGHNKDFRPDLPARVDPHRIGRRAVPIAYRVESGNTADDVTHVPTWRSCGA